MSALIWLALDGVGHPADAPTNKPVGNVWEQDLPTLRPLIDRGWALDAALGVPGLPQSGTGQACWLTGQDAVALMGEHYGPQPGPTLQKLLRAQSLPARLVATGGRAALLNYYAPEYFAALDADARGRGRNRMGCFPFSFRAAGLPLGGSALSDPALPLLRASLGLGYQAPFAPLHPADDLRRTGRAIAAAAADFDLLAADLWLSDLLGHLGDEGGPAPEVLLAGRAYLARLDILLETLLEAGCRVILSSDHGNLEDLNTKSHTVARVPFAVAGVDVAGMDWDGLGQSHSGQPGISTIVEGGQAISRLLGLPTPPPNARP